MQSLARLSKLGATAVLSLLVGAAAHFHSPEPAGLATAQPQPGNQSGAASTSPRSGMPTILGGAYNSESSQRLSAFSAINVSSDAAHLLRGMMSDPPAFRTPSSRDHSSFHSGRAPPESSLL
jgi:hypothetical protein